MSRCVLDDEDREIEVVIGWDPGADSFFTRIFDCKAAKRARQRGASEQEIEKVGLVLWTGGFDRIYDEPDVLISAIIPYANPFDPAVLRHELIKDQLANDGGRNYWMIGDEVDGDPAAVEDDESLGDDEDEEPISGALTSTGPADTAHVSESDVHRALSFLISIEPDPAQIHSIEEYETLMAEYEEPIALAQKTLRRFAEQIEPKTLEAMQRVYYGFTNNRRYLQSSLTSAVVISSLKQAFSGVGPWQN